MTVGEVDVLQYTDKGSVNRDGTCYVLPSRVDVVVGGKIYRPR